MLWVRPKKVISTDRNELSETRRRLDDTRGVEKLINAPRLMRRQIFFFRSEIFLKLLTFDPTLRPEGFVEADFRENGFRFRPLGPKRKDRESSL